MKWEMETGEPKALRACTLEAGETRAVIPGDVRMVTAGAFASCEALESVVIPPSVEEVEGLAFSGLKNLREVTLCVGTRVGEKAFGRCPRLSKLTLTPAAGKGAMGSVVTNADTKALGGAVRTVEEVELAEGFCAIGKNAFKDFKALRRLTMPDTVTEVDGFLNCTALESVVLSGRLKKIAGRAFSGCASLREIRIPDSVTAIGDYAFSRCTALCEPLYAKKGKNLWFVPADVTEFVMPQTVEKIAPTLFYGHEALERVVLSPKLKAVASGAFNGCKSLRSVVIPEGVQSIEKFAFTQCHSLRELTIPASVRIIRDGAFQDCANLERVAFAGTEAVKITYGAFYNCPKLEKPVVPGAAQ